MTSQLQMQLIIGGVFVSVAVVIHIVLLTLLVFALKAMSRKFTLAKTLARSIIFIGICGMYILSIHIVGVWAWAALFIQLGAIESFESALYFSTVTATTVGYGDFVLDEKWRLLGSFEAMFGILSFGISTAFLMAILRQFLSKHSDLSASE